MAKRLKENQINILKNHFCDYVYYNICKSVYEIFRQHNPLIIMSKEDLFVDASRVLDDILISGDLDADKCKELWSDTFRRYREFDAYTISEEVSQAEVAMLCYAVMFGLQAVPISHYRRTLQHTLHRNVHQMWDKASATNCNAVEAELKESINQYTTECFSWMKEYFESSESLTQEIESVLKPKKQVKNKKEKSDEPIPYTLSYNCKDQQQRTRRIDIVRRKWEEWKWIESNTDVNDFSRFFDSTPRDCYLEWKDSNATLYLLLSEMLEKKKLFTKQTGCSARSIIRNQFKKSYDKHTERVDEIKRVRIEWTIRILDYTKSLILPQLPYNGGEDLSDVALQEVFANELHILKDLRKYND